jgi:hypothetical protein
MHSSLDECDLTTLTIWACRDNHPAGIRVQNVPETWEIDMQHIVYIQNY